MGAEHHLPLPGDDADMVDEERCIGPEQVEGILCFYPPARP